MIRKITNEFTQKGSGTFGRPLFDDRWFYSGGRSGTDVTGQKRHGDHGCERFGRLGEVDEIAMAARFIFENDFYTGRCLDLDGGLRL